MIREGPGGSVAVQLPSGPVVTAAAWVNAFEPLSGAVRIATGWPASGRPALLISSPCSLTGRPKARRARVASLAADVRQLVRGSSCCRLVVLAIAACRLGVRQRQRDAPGGAAGEDASRPRAAPGQRGAKPRRRPSCEAQTRRPGQSSFARPVRCRLRAGGAAASCLTARAGASRSGELLEAHLRDGLSPDRQHHASESVEAQLPTLSQDRT